MEYGDVGPTWSNVLDLKQHETMKGSLNGV